MSSHQQTQLNLGNRIYLYNLLRSALGTGKQTFITQAEEALAADELSAENLGFETTRALMEALNEFVTLTVFKGGRVYVTVTAQPAWDEALDAAAEAQAKASGGKGGKPWKRKKGGKTLKAVRPRTVVVEVAEEPAAAAEVVEAAPVVSADALENALTTEAADGAGDAQVSDIAMSNGEATADGAATRAAAPQAVEETESVPDEATQQQDATSPDAAVTAADAPATREADAAAEQLAAEPARTDGASQADDSAPDALHVPEPAYSLTITFDPDHADAGETTVVSTPVASNDAASTPAPAAASDNAAASTSNDNAAPHQEAPAAAPACAANDKTVAVPVSAANDQAAATPASTSPSAEEPPRLDGYPRDFTTDVYCSAATLATLASLLPYGADVLGIVGEYFYIACLRGTVQLRRGRATFPLYYLHDGARHSATVTIKKRPNTDPAWMIDAVELVDE